MHRMNALDAGMFFAENDTTPLQIGAVAVFEGPVPAFGDFRRHIAARLPLAPRCLQRVRTVPFRLAHPVWVDDPDFDIEFHVRRTALPVPGGPDELHALVSRVLAPPMDLTRSPWEVWLVEGLADGHWAAVCKVHHCMVDGIAGIDLLAVLLDTEPDRAPAEPRPWTPEPEPATRTVLREGIMEGLRDLGHQANHLFYPMLRDSAAVAGALPRYAARMTRAGVSALNGPTRPHRRWTRTHVPLAEISRIRRAFGGSVNDVVLAATARAFRDLLDERGLLREDSVVRAMVPVSVRAQDERGVPSNRVSALPAELPCGEPDPVRRLELVREQMNGMKGTNQAAGIDAFVQLVGAVPALLAASAQTALKLRQPLVHTIVTNVPGPQSPLYALGRRMLEIDPYIPIAAGMRTAIGIVSYDGVLAFGLTGDRDAVPDLETLCSGIREGVAELLKEAGRRAS